MTAIDRSVLTSLESLGRLVPGPALGLEENGISTTGEGSFVSAFDVDRAMQTAAAAANAVFGERTLDLGRLVTMAVGSASVDGEPVPVWSDLSGYYETRPDASVGEGGEPGQIQFHCNFPHHAAGVVAELGCEPNRESVQAAVLERDPDELESTLIAKGMIAARLRTMDEWAEHPHAIATADLPLITVERIGDGEPRDIERRRRVLDCSRVLAGPVAGQVFAAHGADVLRVGGSGLPSVEIGVLTTGSGKRNAFVDLGTPAGDAAMTSLLADADVWIDAYRPGALEAKGFGVSVAKPGSVTVQLSAFDWTGPWAGRRGFDSIVQSTTGIVRAGSAAAGLDAPVPLPVQALDYATGLLAAFAAERLVQHQADVGGTWLARLSLLRTRNWLVGMGGPKPFTPSKPTPDPAAMHTVGTPFGAVTTAQALSGSWPHGPQPLGSSKPVWLDRETGEA